MRRPVRGSAEPLPGLGFTLGLPRNLNDWTPDLHYESQAAFLDRHKLLTQGERRRLGADAYAPVRYQHWHERPEYDRVFRTGEVAEVIEIRRD